MWKNPEWIPQVWCLRSCQWRELQFSYLKYLCSNLDDFIFQIACPSYNDFPLLYLSGSKWAFILPFSNRECGTANAHCVYPYCWFGLSEVWPHLPKTKRTLHHHTWPWTCLWHSQKLVKYWCLLRIRAQACWLQSHTYYWWKRDCKGLVRNMERWLHSNIVPYLTKTCQWFSTMYFELEYIKLTKLPVTLLGYFLSFPPPQ
jgi:hypothetical protein